MLKKIITVTGTRILDKSDQKAVLGGSGFYVVCPLDLIGGECYARNRGPIPVLGTCQVGVCVPYGEPHIY